MSNLNPIILLSILRESVGAWFWPALIVVALLLAGMISGALKLRKTRQSPKRPILTALASGLVATIVLAFFVPGWTAAASGSLNGAIDYLVLVLLAMIPGAAIAAIIFSLVSRRCAARGTSSA